MLVDIEEKCVAWPEYVAVIGGGRWARVLLEVLCGLVPSSVRISVHSPHNAPAMLAWCQDRGLDNRIQVSEDYPKVQAEELCAVIVANAARDHEKSIQWALSERLPVLVEKPVTLSFAATQRMAYMSIRNNTYLAAAHVFLFARYIMVFKKLVAESGGVQSIRVRWMDPQVETRYGESKSYDPGLTVYADWLPHIVSILDSFSLVSMYILRKLEVLRGGAHLKMNIRLGDTPCEIDLIRNGNVRQRLIEVDTHHGLISLDFSKEPGSIISGTNINYGDSVCASEPKPVFGMLKAFLLGAAGGLRDSRLDINTGLRASQLIDQLEPDYQAALSSWLGMKCSVIGDGVDSDLRYAFSEILYMDDPCSLVPIEQRIEYLYHEIKDYFGSSSSANYTNNPQGIIRQIINKGKLVSYIL